MSNIGDQYELMRWVNIFNKSHGYGGVFNHETPEDKSIIEMSTAREWCNSISTEFGLSTNWPEFNPEDPPDCFVEIEGQRLGVELVQLINQQHKSRATRDELPMLVSSS